MTTSGKVLAAVATELGISHTCVDPDKVVFALQTPSGVRYCINNSLGLNSEVDEKLCADKAYTYDVLHGVVSMPPTKKYLDPDGPYPEYAQFASVEEIVSDIVEQFEVPHNPVVLKKNSGSLGIEVYWCATRQQVMDAVSSVFSKSSINYDHVLLAQQAIWIATEWRGIVLEGQVQFLYRKDTSAAHFTGNLSPLHWEHSTAVLDEDPALLQRIQAFIDPCFAVWQLPYGGYDIVEDTTGKLWLIEINSHPAFSIFLRDNDPAPLKKLYTKILTRFIAK